MHYFKFNCVSAPDVAALTEAIQNSRQITRKTFLRHVCPEDMARLEEGFGYGPWLGMAKDWYVSYHKSKYGGRVCYYFCQSAIEYVFLEDKDD